MKVALSFPGCHRRGGVERIVSECGRHLAIRGHEVVVLASEFEDLCTERTTYQHVPALKRPGFLRAPSYYWNSKRMLKDLDFDVLSTHGCVCPPGGVHWVQSLHKAWLETSAQFRPACSWSRFRQQANPLHPVLLKLEEAHFRERRYQRIIATTMEVRADLGRLYGVPEEDVTIIPNGFSPTEFNPARRVANRTRMRAKLGLLPDDVALLFVANELKRKGYQTLLEALKILDQPALKLLVVGKSPKREVFEGASSHGLANRVIACGPSAEVADYHAAADLFVLPTQYEAFCLAILEALGSGLPVITTQAPGAHNSIIPGVNGELVGIDEPEELAVAIRSLADESRRAAYAIRASESVKHYQWPAILTKYEEELARFSRTKLKSNEDADSVIYARETLTSST